MTDAPAATIRHLRAELQRAREDAEDLRGRLTYAEEQIHARRPKPPG